MAFGTPFLVTSIGVALLDLTMVEKLDFPLLVSYFPWKNTHPKKRLLFSMRNGCYCFQNSYYVGPLRMASMLKYYNIVG